MGKAPGERLAAVAIRAGLWQQDWLFLKAVWMEGGRVAWRCRLAGWLWLFCL